MENSIIDSELTNLDSLDSKSLNKVENNDLNLEKEISYSNYERNLETLEETLNVIDDETESKCKNSEDGLENKYNKKPNYNDNMENLQLKDELNTVSFETGDILPNKNSNNLISVNTWIEESILQATSINTQKCGLPLQIFSEVYLEIQILWNKCWFFF